MAIPSAVSQALKVERVPVSRTNGKLAWEAEKTATPCVRIPWQSEKTTEFRALRERRLVRESKESGTFCIAAFIPSQAAYDLPRKSKLLWQKNSETTRTGLPIPRRLRRESPKHGSLCAHSVFDDNGDHPPLVLYQHLVLQKFGRARVIGCVRTRSSDVAMDAARAALDSGLSVLEVTMTTPSAVQIIRALSHEYPSALIGAGTVLSKADADAAKTAGAKFLMSPATVEELVVAHRDGPVPYVPGAMTPTEVVRAYGLGSSVVKVYPVAIMGVGFVRTLNRLLPHIPLIGSQGVTLDMVDSYISAGATAVVLSDAIFDKSALEAKDFGRIRSLASEAVAKASSSQSSLMTS